MMRYWAEFARSGTPTGEGGTGEPWPRYDPLKQNFFRIRLESSQVVEMELTRHCSFLAPLRAEKLSLPGAGSGLALPKDL
nr:carboxylesterase 1D-like [Pelodiscus sinensis]|eukprot:XP_025037259.1 carboxylesterase 1D-like [Pelodiscus sinensis]